MRVVALDATAHALGLVRGTPLAVARARFAALEVRPIDRAADARLLDGLAAAGERFTPLLAKDGDDGLLLDVTGCAHLFGGETGLAARVGGGFAGFGMTHRLALGSTPDAAHALVRFAGRDVVEDGGVGGTGEGGLLRGLPVAALETGAETGLALVRAGLTTLGDLEARPSAILSARFGDALSRRLLRVLGREDVRLTPLRPPPELMAERQFLEPLADLAAIEAVVGGLAGEVSAELARRGRGGCRFELNLFRADGAVRRLVVEAGAPLREDAAILRLLRLRIDGLADPLDPGFGFDAVRLAVPVTARLDERQAGLDGRDGEAEALAALRDRLIVRFGAGRVLAAVAGDSHDPVRAGAFRPLIETGAPPRFPTAADGEPPLRPLELFARPEPVEAVAEVPDGPPLRFRWRRVLHEVRAAEGPERIAPEWWRGDAADRPARDYYRVEDAAGRRFWLYREGLYGDGAGPHWFVHGLFP